MRPLGDPTPNAARVLGRADAIAGHGDPGRVRRAGDLRSVATEFEAVMLQELVKAMRATTSLDGKEQKGDTMVEGLVDDAMAQHLARAGGIGLADYLTGLTGLAEPARQSADDTLTAQGRLLPGGDDDSDGVVETGKEVETVAE
ncbi:MAG: rod-binding protein [Deltaproteobacteria bacterium]|nr:rod-binding protein [Deltaproteobacteria bacterium]